MEKEIDKNETCESCDGEGKVNMTCCGINIHGNDIDLCPECGEHCGDESETCETCDGSGEIKQI